MFNHGTTRPRDQAYSLGMLWLLRHAEAADGNPDDERPLTERGMHHAEAAGLAIARLGIHIDVCMSSSKLRAVQTAERACRPLGLRVTIEPALSGEPVDVHALTAGLGDVLLVGHDPSFSLTLHDLTGAQARIKKGGLAGIAKGEVIALLRPDDLLAIANVDERAAVTEPAVDSAHGSSLGRCQLPVTVGQTSFRATRIRGRAGAHGP